MTTTYFGIFPNGETIENNSLEVIAGIPEVEHILKCSKGDSWGNPPTFTIVDSKGIHKRLTVGNYAILGIEEERPGSVGGHKEIIIKESHTGKIFRTETKTPGVQFFKGELLPLLEKLNEIGSWEIYEKLRELEELKLENKSLNAELEKMKSKK